VTLTDEDTSVVNGLGESTLEDEGLETTLHEVLDVEGENVIETLQGGTEISRDKIGASWTGTVEVHRATLNWLVSQRTSKAQVAIPGGRRALGDAPFTVMHTSQAKIYLLVLLKDSVTDHATHESLTLEDAGWVLLVLGEESTGSGANLGERETHPPDLLLVTKAVLADELKLSIETLLLEWTPWRLRLLGEITQHESHS